MLAVGKLQIAKLARRIVNRADEIGISVAVDVAQRNRNWLERGIAGINGK